MRAFLVLFLLGIFVSGCVTADDIGIKSTEFLPVTVTTEFDVNDPSDLIYFGKHLNKGREDYHDCLLGAFISQNSERENAGQSRLTDTELKILCAAPRELYFLALVSTTYPVGSRENSQFRFNTANFLIRETDEKMFAFFNTKFPESMSIEEIINKDMSEAAGDE